MKKFLLSALMFLTALSASAQLISAARDNDGVKFGVRGSFALSNMNSSVKNESNEYYSFSSKQLPAFALGFAMDLPVLESFHFNIELKYAMKGQKFVEEAKGESKSIEKEYTRIGYVEMPIQPQFRLNFSDACHLNVNVGPYIGLAVHGHEKDVEKEEGEKDYVEKYYIFTGKGFTKNGDEDREWYDPDDDFESEISRFDVGMAFGLDFVIEHFHIGASYEVGIKDIYKNADFVVDKSNYTPIKNRTAFFTIGIDF